MKALMSPIPSIVGVAIFAGLVACALNATDAGASVVAPGVIAISLVGGLVASSIASR
jgi:hypothetical protein